MQTRVVSIPAMILALLFSLTLLVSSQIRGHINSRLSSPLPTTVRALHFYREKISAPSSLVDWHRIVPTHRRRWSFSYYQVFLLFLRAQNGAETSGNLGQVLVMTLTRVGRAS